MTRRNQFQRLARWACCAAVVWATACSSEDGTTGGGGEQDIAVDTGGDSGGIDVGDQDVTIIDPDVDAGKPDIIDTPDSSPDVPVNEDFGKPCDKNSDCLEGWCVPSPAGDVCTQTCIDNCPNGWNCELVTNLGQDVTYICINKTANLCRPCASDSDCRSIGIDDAFCIDGGDSGNFCGSGCDNDTDCPKDYSCNNIELPNGVNTGQCQPTNGECVCNAKAVQDSAFTPCVATNEFGSCNAARICLESGLSPCGPEPEAEICNNKDDDCNGVVDDVGETECSSIPNEYGTCLGTAVCQNGQLICGAPAASPEICDGVDNNCDGEIDENAKCDDGNQCTTDACVVGVGCVNTGVTCNDGDACTEDSCNPLTGCVNKALNCDDGNACTTDSCNPAFGCVFTTIVCNDGDVCNGKETCDPATGCKPGTAPNCNDGDVCTNDVCNPNSGCLSQPLNCDDGNSCTADQCNPATGCVHPPLACNDGDSCTEDSCLEGVGCSFKQTNCNDGNACTADSCVSGQGCVNTPVTCDDGDSCTTDTCNPATGCKSSQLNCSDGNQCNGVETCDPVAGCVPGVAPDCDDGLVCTVDSCNPATGCVNSSLDCDDGNACTVDSCDDAGGCVTSPLNCNDGNVCNGVETCNPATGCVAGTDLDCEDGNVCTNDTCNSATGCVNTQLNCADGNACTNDTCEPGVGCVNNNIQCNDNSVCTGTETCNPATGCVPGTPLVCNDGNACTVDSCHPINGCMTAPAVCDDGNACTDDFCEPASGCKTTTVVCDDGNACTVDSCEAGTGCVFTSLGCDDGNPCNGTETCNAASGCVPGTPLDCDDGNICTNDSCNPASGCGHVSISGPCNDGNLCTSNDQCTGGGCVGTPVTCAPDGDPCTSDACNPSTGLCYTAAAPGTSCNDQEQCTAPDACVDGECFGQPIGMCTDPGANLVCVITGSAGDTFDCPFMVANADPAGSPSATALQLTMKYNSSRVKLNYFIDGQFCPVPNNCIGPYTLPDPFTSLQSGHLIEINPKPLSAWNGAGGQGSGEFLLVHLSSPDTPLSSATVQDGLVSGDPVFITATFTLSEDIPGTNPAYIKVQGVSVADPDAQPLAFEILNLIIRTSQGPN